MRVPGAYTHLRGHETKGKGACGLLREKKKEVTTEEMRLRYGGTAEWLRSDGNVSPEVAAELSQDVTP